MYLVILDPDLSGDLVKGVYQTPKPTAADFQASNDGVVLIIDMETRQMHMGTSEGQHEWQDIQFAPEMEKNDDGTGS